MSTQGKDPNDPFAGFESDRTVIKPGAGRSPRPAGSAQGAPAGRPPGVPAGGATGTGGALGVTAATLL